MIKRLFDIIISFIGLIFSIPIIIILVVSNIIIFRENPFFTQERPGFKNKIFKIIKFKTMRTIYDPKLKLLPEKERLNAYGKFIRSTSLDELPELFNVLKGDMSLVGPRPLLVEYLELYDEQQKKRHDVLPGITGWAQINGRNSIDWKEKFELDIWYVENRSFLLDLRIIFITIKNVILRKGISHKDYESAPLFTGNENK